MKKILTVVGTRPNFIKITQLDKAFKEYGNVFEHKLLHTGQHFDENMSKVFFERLKIRKPDYHLDIDWSQPAPLLFGELVQKLCETIKTYQPDLVIVVGDVNSTYAAAYSAYLCKTKIAHVESGLRSFDRSMPEEINRLLTDELADILFVTEESGLQNLGAEGKTQKHIFFVGNTMIDSLIAFDDIINESEVLKEHALIGREFVLITMHRPSNVDNVEGLRKILEIFRANAKKNKLVFPMHPRTKKNFEKFGLLNDLQSIDNLIILPPIGYIDFQKLILEAKFILTDSGGIQEEATFRGVPCLTLRENTERPITIKTGTNQLVKLSVNSVEEGIAKMEHHNIDEGYTPPPLWDGKATQRIVKSLYSLAIKEEL